MIVPVLFSGTSRDICTTCKRAFTPATIPASNIVEAVANDKNEAIENLGVTHAGTEQTVSNKCDSIKVAAKGLFNFNKFKRY